MHYWTGQEWAPSDPSFTLTPEGDAFVAGRVQHQTRLAANLNVAGAVTVTLPDGPVLRSTPVAIGLFDAASGRSAILAGLRDCATALVSSNQVVYEGAFNENGVTADVVYTLENGSLAQDIVITGRLDPAEYGFPTNAVRLQIYTELHSHPATGWLCNSNNLFQRSPFFWPCPFGLYKGGDGTWQDCIIIDP